VYPGILLGDWFVYPRSRLGDIPGIRLRLVAVLDRRAWHRLVGIGVVWVLGGLWLLMHSRVRSVVGVLGRRLMHGRLVASITGVLCLRRLMYTCLVTSVVRALALRGLMHAALVTSVVWTLTLRRLMRGWRQTASYGFAGG
jgi:hypothetical protein